MTATSTMPDSSPADASALLDQLTEMPDFLRRTVLGLPREALLRMPVNDDLHLLEHLWHTRDCDPLLYGLRIRRILAEDRPALEPVDVGAWTDARAVASLEGDQAIVEFEQERAALIAELRGLSADDWNRAGVRDDGSDISVLGIVRQLVAHDRDHRWRIAAVLRGFAGLLPAPAQLDTVAAT